MVSRRWVGLFVASALLGPTAALGAPLPVLAPDSPACLPRSRVPGIGINPTTTTRLTDRTTDLLLDSVSNGSHHVLVTTPPGYDASGATRYPVLYLLHGHGGGARDWFDHDVESIVADQAHPVIVVMPDGGYDGFYSDWYGVDVDGHSGPDGNAAPAWETFHLTEVVGYVDANYPTIAQRGGRAIAGLSMGGFGAMSYAARHPELFTAAGSFSGAVDTDMDYPLTPVGLPLVSNAGDRQLPDNCIWGDPVTQDVNWRDHDPTELAANLSTATLFLSAGNGVPGSGDSFGPAALTEASISMMNQQFDAALTAAGVAHTTDFYGNGVHAWNYWVQELGRFLPIMNAAFQTPRPLPPAVPFTYSTAADHFDVWGWHVTADKSAPALLTLGHVTAAGFDVTGPGILDVVTAPMFEPGATYAVEAAQCVGGCRADAAGRLHLAMALGRPPTQQYLFGTAASVITPHVRVTIASPSRE